MSCESWLRYEGDGATHLGVRVAQLDGDISLKLVLEADGLDARDGLDGLGLAVRDVTDRACVETSQRAKDNFDGNFARSVRRARGTRSRERPCSRWWSRAAAVWFLAQENGY